MGLIPKSKKSIMKDSDSKGPSSLSVAYNVQKTAGKRMAKGGEVQPSAPSDSFMQDDERATSIADAIIRKRKYADGGEVDLEANDAEGPADLDSLNEDAGLKENYTGDDMISKIRQSLKAKRGF